MANATERAEKTEAQNRQHRAKQAAIVSGLRAALEPDEQLLAFARGQISGGWRGKFAIGLEAFFAPDVNIGLTERRFILQHIHATNGTPSDIQPHKFSLEDIAAITFGDIETFGGEPAARLVLRLQDEQHFRIKLKGGANCADAASLAEVFRSLTSARRKSGLSPTQSLCPHCGHILDRPSKFCPYCGKTTTPEAPDADFHAEIVPTASNVSADADAPADEAGSPYSEAVPFSAFLAPELSEAEAASSAPDRVEETAPIISPDTNLEAANFAMQDDAGEDLFPEIPVGASHEQAMETFAAPAETTDSAAHIAYDDAGVPTIELELSALDGIAETAAAGDAEIQNPKPEPQNPSPASTAFWREFARISGVATPEVFAAQNKAAEPKPEEPKSGNSMEELSQAETEPEKEKPAFPLAEEEN